MEGKRFVIRTDTKELNNQDVSHLWCGMYVQRVNRLDGYYFSSQLINVIILLYL